MIIDFNRFLSKLLILIGAYLIRLTLAKNVVSEHKYIIYVALDGYICSEIYFTNYPQYSNEAFSANRQDKKEL